MKELVINGQVFKVEEGQGDEVTFSGPHDTAFINDVIKAQQPVVVLEPGRQMEKAFTQVLVYGQNNGMPFIQVSFTPLRLLNEPRFIDTSYVGKKTKTVEHNPGYIVRRAAVAEIAVKDARRASTLREENEQLTAQNVLLTGELKKYADKEDHWCAADDLLDKSPAACLAEHDAQLLERIADLRPSYLSLRDEADRIRKEAKS